MDEESKEFVGHLEDLGVLELYGVDGEEMVYKIDMVRLKEVSPELYETVLSDMLKELDETLFDLWKRGLVDVSIAEDGEPVFEITDVGREFLNRDYQ